MPNRCASCGGIAGRGRSIQVPGEWVAYLRSERDLTSPVGTLAMPLCTDCYRDVADLREDPDGEDAWASFLDGVEVDALVDEGT